MTSRFSESERDMPAGKLLNIFYHESGAAEAGKKSQVIGNTGTVRLGCPKKTFFLKFQNRQSDLDDPRVYKDRQKKDF